MPRRRFSLRSLFNLAMLVAVAGYWRDLPCQNAEPFAALVNAGEYGKAEAMFGERVASGDADVLQRPFKSRSMRRRSGRSYDYWSQAGEAVEHCAEAAAAH